MNGIHERFGARALANPNKLEAYGQRLYVAAKNEACAPATASAVASSEGVGRRGSGEACRSGVGGGVGDSDSGGDRPSVSDLAVALSLFSSSPLSVCMCEPKLSVVTVNRWLPKLHFCYRSLPYL